MTEVADDKPATPIARLLLRVSETGAFCFAAVFALCVVLLGPGAIWSLKIVPSLVLGSVFLIAGGWVLRTFVAGRLREPAIASTYSVQPVIWILAFGVGIRIAAALLIHPVFEADFLAYWDSAVHLVKAHEYVIFDIFDDKRTLMRAYRPPGPAFLVAVGMSVVGYNIWAPLLVNVLCFSGSLLCVTDACRRLTSPKAAYAAGLLFAVWPSDVLLSGLPQSEAPSILATALLMWLTIALREQFWPWAVMVGLVTGLSCLVRNSNLILVGVYFLICLYRPWSWFKRLGVMAVIVLCTLAPIVPWTMRNMRVLGTPVLVATNGGANFFVANGEGGDGTWQHDMDAKIREYLPDEVMMDRMGFARAKQWVIAHPVVFLKLMIPKLRILTQSDNNGAYWALERGRHYDGIWVRIATIISDLWWVVLWLLAGWTLLAYPRWRMDSDLWFVLTLAIVPETLFLIFLSAERYHAPMVPAVVSLAAYALGGRRISGDTAKPVTNLSKVYGA